MSSVLLKDVAVLPDESDFAKGCNMLLCCWDESDVDEGHCYVAR